MESKGFTLIELIIAIFLLIGTVVGIYSAFTAMTFLTNDATDRLTAVYLAQEGMEIIRNLRDQNWMYWVANPLDPLATWNAFIASDSFSNGAEIDYKTTRSSLISPYSDTDYLKIDENGFYSYTSSESDPKITKFTRKITTKTLADCVLEVDVEVFWLSKANIINPTAGNTVTIKETLYNWYNGYECNL